MVLFSFCCLALLGLGVEAVITNQGMGDAWVGGEEIGDNEVREFTGWIKGDKSDYFMSLESLLQRKKKIEGQSPKLNLFTPGVRNDYESLLNSRASLANLTYKKGPYPGMPKKVMGMYILLADDTEPGFHSNNADWEPLLHPYQQHGSNVLFFTFINPATMDVPFAFRKLAATRGKGTDGAIPMDTLVIFAIGGYAYSLKPNPWEWLTSREKAEAMAIKVARWRDDYGIDGIDLDLEEGAGGKKAAGPNMVHFVRKLKSIHPDLLVSQPTYGYPQVQAEIDVINASWNPGGTSNGLADTIGLMVYEGDQSLIYLKNYIGGSSMWQGFPIKVDVPKENVLLGCKGSASSKTIVKLAHEAVRRDLLGVMVWYCSVRNGLKYAETWDCTGRPDSEKGYMAAMQLYQDYL